MCGICCFIGYVPGYNHTFNGLKMLLNRGWDGVGIIGITDNNTFLTHKFACQENVNAFDTLEQYKEEYKEILGPICMHTRWAVTGSKNLDANVHPHQDYTNKFSIVHNGIIENYLEIKKMLMDEYGIKFNSQTDTEVMVNLISVLYNKHQNVELAMQEAFETLEGTWGVVLITTDQPNKMYCARHGSPLLVGFGENFMMVASEQSGFCNYVNNYICLNDSDIITLEKRDGKVYFEKQNEYIVRNVTTEIVAASPDPYPYWTLKEINEQSDSILRTMGNGSRILNDQCVQLGGLNMHQKELIELDNLIMLGCGTSYHAALFSAHVFKEISGFNTVQVIDGAEFKKYDVPKSGKTGLIFISQSGETKDLANCLSIGKDMGLVMIGVINVVDSLIAREVHCGVYLNAGKEMGIASTKAFTSQVTALYLIAIWFAQNRDINVVKREQIIEDLRRLPLQVRSTIEYSTVFSKKIAQYLQDKTSAFILGKDKCEASAKEGSLKIKEIGYLHTEAYSTSSLKHGPYALLDGNTPVILLLHNNSYLHRNLGVADEIVSRNTDLIGISDIKLDNRFKFKLKIPANKTFGELLSVIPMQLISYELAVLRGYNPDFPRNLCKSVTVD